MARNTGKPIAFENKPPARNGLERMEGRWGGWKELVINARKENGLNRHVIV